MPGARPPISARQAIGGCEMRHSLMLAGFLCATDGRGRPGQTRAHRADLRQLRHRMGPRPADRRRRSRRSAAAICALSRPAMARALLARLMLEGARTEADMVLGLDTNLTAEAAATGLFAPHGLARRASTCRCPGTTRMFAALRLGLVRLCLRQHAAGHAARRFRRPGASDVRIVIQDPRSSTPGLGLLLWVKAAYGDRARRRSGRAWPTIS